MTPRATLHALKVAAAVAALLYAAAHSPSREASAAGPGLGRRPTATGAPRPR
jgi:hypothetical protein